ncbi:hypothetical protein [Citrobacter freundii]|uniref:hypothetical protein n=1 Tax=Citrobacter freundii TaxID=546 RepID=UPI00388CF1B5|nr:hypothetical protein [Citrobacter freundii]
MIKPVFGIGGPLTDANFNTIKMSKKQAQQAADRLARKTISSGLSICAKGFVFDAGEHYRISVCVSSQRVSL